MVKVYRILDQFYCSLLHTNCADSQAGLKGTAPPTVYHIERGNIILDVLMTGTLQVTTDMS